MMAADKEMLEVHHRRMLAEESGISGEAIAARGYRTVTKKADLETLGFARYQRNTPTLLIPIYAPDGQVSLYQHRPDTPRCHDGRVIKYETVAGSRMHLDVHPSVRGQLRDPHVPLWVTEGVRKGDALVSRNLCAVALLGVWCWRGTNDLGGKAALADWEIIVLNGRQVYLVFDSDVMRRSEVAAALARLKAFLESRGATVKLVYLSDGPDGAKVGVDDFLVGGGTIEQLVALATHQLRRPDQEEQRCRQQEIDAAEALTVAAPVLDSARPLDLFRHELARTGFAGDTAVPELLLLTFISRLTDRPVNVHVEGASASGKNYAVETVMEYLPPEAVYHVGSGISPRHLVYTAEEFSHRHIYIAEARSFGQDEVGRAVLNSIAWDARLRYGSVSTETSRPVGFIVEKEGPSGLVTTSVGPLPRELDTRFITVAVSEDDAQTEAVLRAAARRLSGETIPRNVDPWRAAQRWLHLKGVHRVVIPYMDPLVALLPRRPVRLRRDIWQVAGLISAHALLAQRQRRVFDGAVVAGQEDYEAVFGLECRLQFLTGAVAGGVTETVLKYIQAATDLLVETEAPVTYQQVADRLGVDPAAAHRNIRKAEAAGFVVNEETRPRHPAKLRPASPPAEARSILPHPDLLFGEGAPPPGGSDGGQSVNLLPDGTVVESDGRSAAIDPAIDLSRSNPRSNGHRPPGESAVRSPGGPIDRLTRFAGAEVAACAVCGLPPLTVSRAGVPLCESHGEEALLDAWRAAGSPLVRLPPPRSIPDLEYRLKGAPVPPDGEGIRQIIAALEAQTERQP